MKTAEELKNEIVFNKIRTLENNIPRKVMGAWNILERIAISHCSDCIELYCPKQENSCEYTILNSEHFDDFKRLLILKGYQVHEYLDNSSFHCDNDGKISIDDNPKVIGYVIRW